MRSWVASANVANCHFPIQNIPFGVAKLADGKVVCATAIGDQVVNLAMLEAQGLIRADNDVSVFNAPALNDFMSLGPARWKTTRDRLIELLQDDGGDRALRNDRKLRSQALLAMSDVEMLMPFQVAEYTDFYAGKQHAINVGTMFRGAENALPPNWLHLPIGYNGRASSVVVSGTDIHRPWGQLKHPGDEMPTFEASKKVDIELEMGAVVGCSSVLGQPITTSQANEMIFGYVLLNDWSSRDIQAWEYQPLGPFQGKAFGTSISPWVITQEALEPFRCPAQEPEKTLLPYLDEKEPGLFDIKLKVSMQPQGTDCATTLAQTNYNRLYYSATQQLTHHAISGCQMNVGDLLGSGTISGPTKSEYGSLLEMCWGGEKPFTLDTGEIRTFIEDYDRLTLTGWAEGDGYIVGFGSCTGRILPAVKEPDWSA